MGRRKGRGDGGGIRIRPPKECIPHEFSLSTTPASSFRIAIGRLDFGVLLPDVLLDYRPRLNLCHHQEDVERVAHQVKSRGDEEHGPPGGESGLKSEWRFGSRVSIPQLDDLWNTGELHFRP